MIGRFDVHSSMFLAIGSSVDARCLLGHACHAATIHSRPHHCSCVVMSCVGCPVVGDSHAHVQQRLGAGERPAPAQHGAVHGGACAGAATDHRLQHDSLRHGAFPLGEFLGLLKKNGAIVQ